MIFNSIMTNYSMKHLKHLLPIVFIIIGVRAYPQQVDYQKPFVENFNKARSRNFQSSTEGKAADFICRFGERSPDEKRTKVLSLKIDPEGAPGAGRGPEVISKGYTHFGTYAARIKVPDVRKIQPDAGAVVGYFTYHVDSVPGLSEIDFEWLVANPEIIYIGTWTGQRGALQRIGRTLNLATGTIYNTAFRVGHNGVNSPLTGMQNQPETVPAVDGYDASSRFYTYGFDWYPDRIRWWMINPAKADTVVLWDYQGSQVGIPQNKSRYRMNFWHTDSWPVETNPNSIEKPLHPYETQIDWMSYHPFSVKN